MNATKSTTGSSERREKVTKLIAKMKQMEALDYTLSEERLQGAAKDFQRLFQSYMEKMSSLFIWHWQVCFQKNII